MRKLIVGAVVIAVLMVGMLWISLGDKQNGEPDLIISDLIMQPEYPADGDEVSFRVVVTNAGTGVTPQGTVHRVSVTLDGFTVLAADDTYINSIAPGKSVEIPVRGSDSAKTWKAKEGSYRLVAFVDEYNKIVESKEDNNLYRKNVFIVTNHAKMADSFVDSVGVNIHTSYTDTAYYQFDMLKAKLLELGIRYVRDGLILGRADQIERLNLLADAGIKINLLISRTTDGKLDPESIDSMLYILKNDIKQAVSSVEGPNEYDNRKLGAAWSKELYEFQKRLYERMKADIALAAIPVLGPSVVSKSALEMIGELSPYVDFPNIHPYPGGSIPSSNISDALQSVRSIFRDKPVYVTESGYHNGLNWKGGHPPVSETASGKYTPRLLFEYFNRGVVRTYLYEFLDLKPDPEKTDREKNFGLLRNDFSEKPAFVSLKNIIKVLQDPGESFVPGTLDYQVHGNTARLQHTLLQKRDGRFYLALWLEANDYDLGKKQDMTVEPQEINIIFRQSMREVRLLRPSTTVEPVKTWTKPVSITLHAEDEVMLIEMLTEK